MNRTLYFLIVCVLIGGHLVSFAMEEGKSLVAYNGQQGQVVQGAQEKNVGSLMPNGGNGINHNNNGFDNLSTAHKDKTEEVNFDELPEKPSVEQLQDEIDYYKKSCVSLAALYNGQYKGFGTDGYDRTIHILRMLDDSTSIPSKVLSQTSYPLDESKRLSLDGLFLSFDYFGSCKSELRDSLKDEYLNLLMERGVRTKERKLSDEDQRYEKIQSVVTDIVTQLFQKIKEDKMRGKSIKLDLANSFAETTSCNQ